MTNFINTAETGLADETAAVTANTSAGTAGTALTVVTAATGTVKYDTAHAHRGTLAYRFDGPVTGDVARVEYAVAGNSATWEPYIWLTAYPAIEQPLLQIRNSTGNVAYIQITAAGNVRLYDATPTALWLSANPLPLNQWVRLNLQATKGTNAASPFNGTIKFSYFAGADLETATPTETTAGASFFSGMTETTVNTGTVALSVIRLGKLGSGGVWSGVLADDIQWNDATAAAIGPVSTTGAAPVSSWTVADIRRINATGTTGSPTSYSLTRSSGPTTGFTITQTSTGIFEVVLTATLASTLVLSLVTTNANGTDTDLISIPATGASSGTVVRDYLVYDGSALV